MKMTYLRMVYICKILAKKFRLLVNFQWYGTFFRKSNMASKYWSVRNAGVASATGKSNLQMLHEVTF